MTPTFISQNIFCLFIYSAINAKYLFAQKSIKYDSQWLIFPQYSFSIFSVMGRLWPTSFCESNDLFFVHYSWEVIRRWSISYSEHMPCITWFISVQSCPFRLCYFFWTICYIVSCCMIFVLITKWIVCTSHFISY